MTLIELGDVSAGSAAPEPPAPPLVGARMRRYAAAAVAALTLLLVAGAERPEARLLPELWTVAGDNTPENFMLTANTLYVPGQPVRAYDAASGRLRWTRPTTGTNNWVYTETGGVTLLPGASRTRSWTEPDGSTHSEETVADTVAVDAETGAELWRHPGEPAWTEPGTVLLVTWDFQGHGMTSARAVGLRDGTQRWSWAPRQPVPRWTLSGEPGEPGSLVTGTADGVIEVRRTSDGTVSARGRVPWAPRQESGDAYTELIAQGDTVVVARAVPGRVMFDGYALDSLERRWSAAGAAFSAATRCSPVLCVSGGPDGLAGRDPRTGAVRWRLTGWDNAHPLPGGRLMLTATATGGSGLADAATGRVIADLGPRPALFDHELGTVLTLTPAREPLGGTVVYEVAPDARRVLRGLLTGTVVSCQVAGRRLACADDGVLTVRAVG